MQVYLGCGVLWLKIPVIRELTCGFSPILFPSNPNEMLILQACDYTLNYTDNPGQTIQPGNPEPILKYIEMPLIPRRKIIWGSTLSSRWKDKVWSPFCYSFLSQMLPVIIQAANLIVWLWRRVCVSPWRFLKRFECRGKSWGFFIEKRINTGYHVWLCQVGTISIKDRTFSNSTFLSTLCITENGGKA